MWRSDSAAMSTSNTTRLRLAAFVAAPVLALTVACGGGAADTPGSDDIASVPEAPSDAASKDKGDEGARTEPPDAGKSAFFDAQMKYVQCMRTKGGIKDFPDPKLSGYLDWAKVDAITDPNGKGEEQKGGKNGVCGREMSEAMKQEPKRDAQKDYESMLGHAKCMRENGVSKFTNPTMSGGNVMPGGDPNPANPTFDTKSPAYKQAREACGKKLLDGLDGMQ
jgi:hypothetical protein